MKKHKFTINGRTIEKERASIQYGPTHGFSVAKCDLCDEEKYPMVSWCCEHDDPAHITTVCFGCLCEIIQSENDV